jgi:hypothetical protein
MNDDSARRERLAGRLEQLQPDTNPARGGLVSQTQDRRHQPLPPDSSLIHV